MTTHRTPPTHVQASLDSALWLTELDHTLRARQEARRTTSRVVLGVWLSTLAAAATTAVWAFATVGGGL